jgi:hypothetical protein
LDEVAIEIGRPRSHVEAEGMSRGQTNRSSLHSTTPCGSNDEDLLPTLEICLHIAIEVVCRLKMAQERRLLLVKEVSLVDFLLYQVLSLKEVVAQHGSVVPHIILERLGYKQVALSMDMTTPIHKSLMRSTSWSMPKPSRVTSRPLGLLLAGLEVLLSSPPLFLVR